MPPLGAIDVQAELHTPAATAQRVRYHFAQPPDSTLNSGGGFRVELCLSRRHSNSRGNFRGHWNPHRFERIGDLFLVPPNMDLAARSDEMDSLDAVVCQLHAETVLELFDTRPPLIDRHLSASLDIRDAKIHGLMLRLADEMQAPGFASQMRADLAARQMAEELFRLGTAIREQQRRGGLAAWQLKRIDERLCEASAPPTLVALAELCRLSVRQLTRAFRVSRGCSLGTYVAGNQMEHARRMLASGESVASVASTLGFSSSPNFCFAFRRATNMSPGEYRSRRKGR